MGLFDKVKNLFTEEIEEEKPVRKEVRHVEIPTPKREEKVEEVKSQMVEPKAPVKEEKFVFFDDKDFDDLDKKEVKPEIKKEEVKTAYKGVKPYIKPAEEKKIFKPSPIISPIYGVLDKNYKKDDIISRPVKPRSTYYTSSKLTIDDVRNRAFSTLEDDLKNELLENDYIKSKREPVVDDLNMFSDEDDSLYDTFTEEQESVNLEQSTRVRKNEMLFDDDMDEETEFLAQKLAEQRKKLDEISSIIADNDEPVKTRIKKEEPKKSNKKLTLDEVLEKAEKKSEIKEELTDEEILEEIIEEVVTNQENKKAVVNQIDEAFEDAFGDIDSAIDGSNKVETEDIPENELFDLIDSMYEKKDDDEE